MFKSALACCLITASTAFAQEEPSFSKESQIIWELGFNSGMAPLITRMIPRTEANAQIQVKCGVQAAALQEAGVEAAFDRHLIDWTNTMGGQFLAVYGQEFVDQADLEDLQALDKSVRTHPEFNTFLNGLEDILSPILSDATATAVSVMWAGCFGEEN